MGLIKQTFVDQETVITARFLNELQDQIIQDETTVDGMVAGVKGNSESEYRTGNVNITKANIGLGNVDNTSDADKPVSTATTEALNSKVDKVSGKGLSTNDYTNDEKAKLGDLPTKAALDSSLNEKVDKVEGKGLSTNDYTDGEKEKASQIDGVLDSLETKEASGSIVTIDDAFPGPVEELKVAIEPVQDLHGYANPWPGGAGKNKSGPLELGSVSESKEQGTTYADMQLASQIRARSISLIPTNGQQYTVSWDATKYMVAVASFDENQQYLGRTDGWRGWSTVTFKQGDSSTYFVALLVKRTDEASMTESDFANCKIQLELGSTATDYSPYSNICPISGWTGVEVIGTGKNLIDWKFNTFSSRCGVYLNEGQYIMSGANNLGMWYIRGTKQSGSYCTNIEFGLSSWIKSNTMQNVYYGANNNASITFNVPEDGVYIEIGTQNGNGTVPAMLELGSTATDYEPYIGSQISVTFPSEAGDSGTVYGGTLTINPDRTGTLVVDKAMLTANGTESWTVNSNLISRCCNLVIPDMKLRSFLYCNLYDFVSTLPPVADRYGKIMTLYNSGLNQNVIGVGYNAGETVDLDGFKAFLSENPLQVVYELASPRTYQLTAEQVSDILTVLRGTNNVWASAGDILSLKCKAGEFASMDTAERLVNEKAPAIIEKVSGAIASFSDGADSMPVKKLVAQIEPVQDLHGYDHPWPAGGGANQWDEQWEVGGYYDDSGAKNTSTDRIRNKNYIPVTPGTTYFVVGARICWFEYDSDKNYLRVGNSGNFVGPDVSFSVSSDCYFINFVTTTSYGTTYNNNIAINYPATVTTYSPYSNICPISGWTGAIIHGTAVNIFGGALLRDGIKAAISSATIDDQAKTIEFTSGASIVKPFTSEASLTNRFKANTQYTFLLTYVKTSGNNTASNMRIYYTDGSYTNITPLNSATTKQTTVTVSEAGKTINSLTKANAAGWTAVYYEESGIFEGVLTADDFTPYTGTTLPITFTDPTTGDPMTVYGGTVTLNDDGSADVVTTEVGKVYDGTETGWIWTASYQQAHIPLDSPAFYNVNQITWKCNLLTPHTNASRPSYVGNYSSLVSNGNSAAFSAPDCTTLEEFLNYISSNNLQFVYKLATPTAYHFDNIGQLYTYFGTNNIWSSTGDTEVTYPADTKAVVETKADAVKSEVSATQSMLATVETTSTASKSYAVGDMLVYNNQLYKVASAIPAGAMLTPGTNIVSTTVDSEIRSRNDSIVNDLSRQLSDVESVLDMGAVSKTVSGTHIEITDGVLNSNIISISGPAVMNNGNLLPDSYLESAYITPKETEGFNFNRSGFAIVNNERLASILEPGLQYTVSFDFEMLDIASEFASDRYGILLQKSGTALSGASALNDFMTESRYHVGYKQHFSSVISIPDDGIGDLRLLVYNGSAYNTGLSRISNLIIAGGNSELPWVKSQRVDVLAGETPEITYLPAYFDAGESVTVEYMTDGISNNAIDKLNALVKTIETDEKRKKYTVNPHIKNICHRGYSKIAPEDTEPAYVYAKIAGYEYVENDLWFTSDGVPVMVHARDLSLVSNGTGNIDEVTYSYFKSLDFGQSSTYGDKYAGLKGSSLEEFVLLCKKLGLKIYLDCKSFTPVPSGYNSGAEKAVEILKKHRMENATSFLLGESGVQIIRSLLPNARVGYMSNDHSAETIEYLSGLAANGEVFIDSEWSTITSDVVNSFHEAEIPVEAWNADLGISNQRVIEIVETGVDGITADGINLDAIITESLAEQYGF